MKTIILSIIVCFLMCQNAKANGYPVAMQDTTRQIILEKIESGKPIDLKLVFPDDSTYWVVNGDFLVSLLTENIKIHPFGLYISNAYIEGNFIITGTLVSVRIVFINCTFSGVVNLNNSNFNQVLFLKCNFNKKSFFDQITVERNFSISGSTFLSSARFTYSEFRGEFNAGFTKFLSNEKVNFDFITVFKAFSLKRSVLNGPVDFGYSEFLNLFEAFETEFNSSSQNKFDNMKISRHLLLAFSKFKGNVRFDKSIVGGNFILAYATFYDTSKIDFGQIEVYGYLTLKHSIFNGPLSFQFAKISNIFEAFAMKLNSSKLSDLTNLNVGGQLLFTQNQVMGAIRFSNSQISGNVALSLNNFISRNMVEFTNCSIGGDVNISGSIFNGLVNFWGSKIGGSIIIFGSTFDNAVFLDYVQIDNNLEVQKSNFNSTDILSFSSIYVNQHVLMKGNNFYGNTIFDYSVILGNYRGEYSGYYGNDKYLSFQYCEVGGSAYITKCVYEANVDFSNTLIRSNFIADSVVFGHTHNYLQFDNLSVKGFLSMNGNTLPDTTSIRNSEVGQLIISEAILKKNKRYLLLINDSKFNESIELSKITNDVIIEINNSIIKDLFIDNDSISAVNLVNVNVRQSKIENTLMIQNLNLNALNLLSINVVGKSFLTHLKINERVDFGSSKMGDFYLSDVIWPSTSDSFIINNLEYNQISYFDTPNLKYNQDSLLAFLKNAKFDLNAYTYMERYFNSHGLDDFADEIYENRKDREASLTSFPEPIWYWILQILFGYGKSPTGAIIVSIMIIIFGWWLFNEKKMYCTLSNQNEESYCALLYSIDLFLPVIDLRIANSWRPKKIYQYVNIWRPIHQILGWVFITSIVLAYTGYFE